MPRSFFMVDLQNLKSDRGTTEKGKKEQDLATRTTEHSTHKYWRGKQSTKNFGEDRGRKNKKNKKEAEKMPPERFKRKNYLSQKNQKG